MKWFIGGALVAALLPTHIAFAQPLGYEEALRAAREDQPLLQASEMRVRGSREASRRPDVIRKPGARNMAEDV